MEHLELHLFTADQNSHTFCVNGVKAIDFLLEELSPDRAFRSPLMTFQCPECTATFRTSAVTRVDLLTKSPPPWPLHFGLFNAVQVTEERFIHELDRARRDGHQNHEGRVATRLVELALINRRRIFLLLEADATIWNEEGGEVLLQKMLEAPSYHFRRREKGVVVLNAANVIHADFYPGLERLPRACEATPMLGGGSLVTSYAAVET